MAAMVAVMAAPAFATPGFPKEANGQGGKHPDTSAFNNGTANASGHTPLNQPGAYYCY
jgi:hypothetical protein